MSEANNSTWRISSESYSLEGAKEVIFDNSIRKVVVPNPYDSKKDIVDYNLFPYQIKNRELFYQREHPKQLNPDSFSFKSYWGAFAKKAIEGIWVDDGGTMVYMMPKLFFFINYMRIIGNVEGDEDKRKWINPDLSSLEWIQGSYVMLVDGFSGFEGDDQYTCNQLVKKLHDGKSLSKYDRKKLDNCYTSKGDLKIYVDPWEYLTRFYLIDNPSTEDLGLPLYENTKANALVSGARGAAKDLTEGTIVYTENGPVKIDGVALGDKVFGADGELARVTEKLEFDDQEQYEIEFDDGRKVRCGHHHKWSVRKSGWGGYKVLELNEILEDYDKGHLRSEKSTKSKVGKRDTVYFVPQSKPTQFGEKDLGIDPYFLGLWLGDGHSRAISVTTEDFEVEEYVKKYAEDLNLRTRVENRSDNKASTYFICQNEINLKGNTYKVECRDKEGVLLKVYNSVSQASIDLNIPMPSIYDCIKRDDNLYKDKYRFRYSGEIYHPNPLRQEFVKLSLLQNKHIPDVYKYSSVEQRYELIRGLLDSDGTVSKNGTISFSQKDGKLLEDFVSVVRSLGIKCRVRKYKLFVANEYRTYCKVTVFSGKNLFKIKRKLDRVKPDSEVSNQTLGQRYSCGIRNIKSIGVKKSYCINIDNNNHLFVCDDYVVTHNSIFAYGGDFMHTWTFGGIRTYEERKEASTKMLFAAGAGASSPLNRSMKIVKGFYDSHPGKFRYPDPKKPDYMGPFYKKVQGAWEGGSEIEHIVKYKNQTDAIVGSSFQMNVITPDKKKIGAGDRFIRLYVEEAGLIEYLNQIHSTNKDSMEVGLNKVGSAYYTGTAGDLIAIEAMKAMILNPEGYQMASIPNYWKANGSHITLFLSAIYKYRNLKDENGNNDLDAALEHIQEERLKFSETMDSSSFDDHILNNPISPDEMLRPNRRSFLPVNEAQKRLGDIEDYKYDVLHTTVGDLEWDYTEKYSVKFKKDMRGALTPLTTYNIDRKKIDIAGAYQIYEHPPEYIPENLFWVVFDPVSKPGKGLSLDSSLNCAIVYKAFYRGNENTLEDSIVADWIGRLDDLDETYERVVKLAKYYNAKIFPETNTPGFVDYCKRNGYAHMLQSEAYAAEKEINPNFRKRGAVGFTVHGEKKIWMLQWFKTWLLKKRNLNLETGEFDSRNIDHLLPKRLLNEIINFNETQGNYDYISTMLGLMLLIVDIRENAPVKMYEDHEVDLPIMEQQTTRRRRSTFEELMY